LVGKFLLESKSGSRVKTPRQFGVFQSATWYARSLQAVLDGLQFQVQAMPELLQPTNSWPLVEDFGAHAWVEDLQKQIESTNPEEKISVGYWGRWAWNTIWLGSVIRVFDKALGEALFKDGFAIYQELSKRNQVPVKYQSLFEGSTQFIEGNFKEAAAKFALIADVELALWLAEESAWNAYWKAGAKGAGYRRLKDEYASPVLDLSSRVRGAYMSRSSKDFNEGLLQLSNLSPLNTVLWFGAAQGQWRLRKDGAGVANKMFLTGLAALALNPGSVQAVYWKQFAEFQEIYGRQATAARARLNYEIIEAGDLESATSKSKWWDLNSPELDITTVADEVLQRSAKATLNSRDMATLYVLGFVAPNGSKYLTMAASHWAFEEKWKKAKGLFEKIVKIDSKNPEALGGLVWTYANLYRFGEALDAHDRFGSTGAKTPEDLKYMGVIQSIGRDYEAADASFDEYIKSVPNDPYVHYFKAENYLRQQKNVDCVRSANLGRMNSQAELFMRTTLLFYRCRVLAGMDIKSALNDLAKMTERDPESIPIALEYIRGLQNASLPNEALEFNRELLSQYSRSFELRMMLGFLYEKRSDFDRAVAFYSRARQDSPDSAEPVVRIGKIFAQQKRFDLAAQNFETAARVQPDYPEVFLFAARSYRQARKFDDAAQMYFQEIEERPAVISSFIEAAEFFLEVRAPQEVPKLFLKFQDDFHNDPRVRTRLAQAYLALSDIDRAQENALAAMRANNKIPEPYRILGIVYEEQAQYDEAAKYFESYLHLLPMAPDAVEIRAKLSNSPYR
jgi:tetratricopeptide (TPR) repeat protein